MKEIKYKAWDIVDKVVRNVTGIEFYGSRKRVFLYGGKARYTSNVILMVYTGLEDKRGREIYDSHYFVAEGTTAFIHYSVNHACWFWGNERFSNAIAKKGLVTESVYESEERRK